MLDHQKTILNNLHNNRLLFVKELKKSMNWLTMQEIKELEHWIATELSSAYDNEVRLMFRFAS